MAGGEDAKYAVVETLRQQVRQDARYVWVDLPYSISPAPHQLLVRQRGAVADANASAGANVVSLLETDSIPQYVWPAATPMCEWVASHADTFRGKTVLELGCGTGVVGLVAAQYAHFVVLTDGSPISLALVLESVAQSRLDNCAVAPLRWGKADQLAEIKRACGVEHFDVVIGSDVFYFNNTLKCGLATARSALARADGEAGVFLCGSVARSDRMEVDLEEVPPREGFCLVEATVQDAFRLYVWKVSEAV